MKIKNFSLEQTLECGQCFHFEKIEENHYVFVVKNRAYDIRQNGEELEFLNFNEEEFKCELEEYFDLNTDYDKIQSYLCKKDEKLKNSINEMRGIKILKQDFFETLISFIISANNQIPRIKKAVAEISQKYGKYIGEIYGKKFYSFPSVEALSKVSEEELRLIGVGFRAKYIVDACDKVLNKEVVEEDLRKLSQEEIFSKLMSIKGVGIKVASCVALFSLNQTRAFPIDVWIKRIMQEYYFEGKETKNEVILDYAIKLYAPYEGYAQQYLFHFGRTNLKK